jgi:hypothetical protein
MIGLLLSLLIPAYLVALLVAGWRADRQVSRDAAWCEQQNRLGREEFEETGDPRHLVNWGMM